MNTDAEVGVALQLLWPISGPAPTSLPGQCPHMGGTVVIVEIQIAPCLLTLLSLVGVRNFHSEDDIWDLYAPLNALSRTEEKAMERFERVASLHHYKV